MKVAYLINQYPKISHSFIRREILALERAGVEVERIALRGWGDELTDEGDRAERLRTRYILQGGAVALLGAVVRTALGSPARFGRALKLALRTGRRADRPLPIQLIYLAEACLLRQWLGAAKVEHLHAHFGTNPAQVAMLTRALGGPRYSFTVHGPEEFDKPQFLAMRDKIANSAFVAAVSSFGRSQLFRWARYEDWHKVEVVHCGVDPTFHQHPDVPLPAAPRVVCVGRLCEQKGQLMLVQAVRQLRDKGVRVELVLAGDGEMRGELEALIASHQLHDQVTITGWLSGAQVRDHMLAARAMVLPSFAEGLPVVVMEAMALRRPVLSTYIAGIPELVQPGKTGWLFPAGDIDALAATLEAFIALPDEALAPITAAAYQRVLERHSIDTEAAKLARHFQRAGQA
jgi:glycosyltransferase involved in cell wall biosynthesis